MKQIIKLWNKFGMWILLVVLYAAFSIIAPTKFFTTTTLLNILKQAAVLGTCAVGYSMVMISGSIDLSVGPRIAFIGIVATYMMLAGMNMALAVVIAMLLGAVTGALNAVLTEILHTYVFVVTLAMSTIWNGVCYLITNGATLHGIDERFINFSQYMVFGKIPLMIFIFFGAVLVGHYLLSSTRYGRYVYALGGNREATFLAGINAVKQNIMTHAIGGLFVGLAAMLLLSRTMTVHATTANTYSFDCITAACLGGVILSGGHGKIPRVILGILILNTLFNGLTIMGVNDFWQMIIKGLLLFVAIAMEVLQRGRLLGDAADLPEHTPNGEKVES